MAQARLSQATILAAALRLADDHGPRGVSMRRVAGTFGVAPNALYTYFSSKDELVDALLDSLLGTITAAETGDWEDSLVELLRDSRTVILAHPKLTPLFFSRQFGGANALRLGETTLALLVEGGIEGWAAVRALRVLLIFTFGFAAFEAPRAEEGEARTERGRQRWERLDPLAFPHSHRLAAELSRHPSEDDFEIALRALIRGVSASGDARG